MDTAALTKLAMAAGIAFAAYKFAPNAAVKTGALSVLAIMAARQVPYVKDYV